MAEYTFTGSITAPPTDVWNVVREFTRGEWMGVEMKSDGEGVGATRTIDMGGASLTEECEVLDDDGMVMGYTITEGAGMPFEDYHSTMHVRPSGEGTELLWKARYEPVGDAATAEATLQAIYGGGFQALKKHCEG